MKNSHIHLHMLCVHKVVSWKNNFSFGLRKKLVLKTRHLCTCFVFLHGPRAILFFCKTLQTHMDYGVVYVKFFIWIFWHFEICFFNIGIESICTWKLNWISANTGSTSLFPLEPFIIRCSILSSSFLCSASYHTLLLVVDLLLELEARSPVHGRLVFSSCLVADSRFI
jgi:hypothetical protein